MYPINTGYLPLVHGNARGRLSGYILSEKVAITRNYLEPNALLETGLEAEHMVRAGALGSV